MSYDPTNYSGKMCAQRRSNGDPCKQPALIDQNYCQYHKVCGPPAIHIDNAEASPSRHVYLPQLQDATSIRSAISEVCEMLLHRRIESKEAGVLLYAMQVASCNLSGTQPNPNLPTNSSSSSATVQQNNFAEDPAAQPSSKSDGLPPGTIQACHPSRRPVI